MVADSAEAGIRLPVRVPNPPFAIRRAEDPAADLTVHRLVHRAQRTDIKRMAATLRALAGGQGCGEQQTQALVDYFGCIAHSLLIHQRIAEQTLLPMLNEMGVEPPFPASLDSSAKELDVLLEYVDGLMEQLPLDPAHVSWPQGLSPALDSLVELVEGSIDGEERSVFPLIRSHLSEESYRWIEGQCLRSLKPQLLSFIVPWVLSHATDTERLQMKGQGQFPLGAILTTFGSCFLEKQKAAFG
jgi:hypothetical protein